MSKYICSICGYVFDESAENKLENLDCCPLCKQPVSKFIKEENEKPSEINEQIAEQLEYDKNLVRQDESIRHMDNIHKISVENETLIDAMATKLPIINWDDILILGAQLNPPPLDEHEEVSTKTIIGKKAKKPMVIETPIYISHMSFGALSKEAKVALSKGSAMAKTAMCSGEGGILPEEKNAAYKYIFEYVPNKYSVTEKNLKEADAIEIKIGQGTKPGMGGHLPGSKVTEEIAEIRNKPLGKDVISPSKFPEINSKEDLKNLVTELRNKSEGRPIGVKIAAGRIEKDLEFCVFAQPDFITIDGRGGATGASPKFLRDSTSVPTIYALYRAKKYLKEVNADIDLVITGGFRISTDFAKAIAMGADCVAISTAALISIGCQQYEICGDGNCPMGIATQNVELRKRLNTDTAAKRLYNYLNVSTNELKTVCRITGHNDIHSLSVEDLITTSKEISDHTNIPHA